MPRGPDNGTGETGSPKESPAGGAVPASFEDALLALVPGLRRYSHSLARSDADGEDLLQDCVETVLARRAQWRGVNLRSWAFTIMTNLYRNRHRAAVRRPTTVIEDAQDVAVPDQTGDPLERARIRAALESLSPENRTTLMLVVVEGYSYQETADILAIPIGTVMSRLSRARHQLAEQLAKDNIVALRRPK
ncbi:RNA polymerase sigma factor [Mycoplana dimorpha]|uniref:RNA polymerase sigma-70 factor (ECF subfamily) n=1 Tax=Mycoplana dimorpha TaxID=28320 RepID=A0A2T5AZ31_MYCDI|nr:RNA polymerase sigma factor [Mycoplana dimorpha]PTM91992.1 RNA polymerase sigma-70 factor (ECF subfamily) [Mycoplana dimorpha]